MLEVRSCLKACKSSVESLIWKFSLKSGLKLIWMHVLNACQLVNNSHTHARKYHESIWIWDSHVRACSFFIYFLLIFLFISCAGGVLDSLYVMKVCWSSGCQMLTVYVSAWSCAPKLWVGLQAFSLLTCQKVTRWRLD